MATSLNDRRRAMTWCQERRSGGCTGSRSRSADRDLALDGCRWGVGAPGGTATTASTTAAFPSADRIVPELQRVEVGDIFPWAPSAEDGFVVGIVEPERALRSQRRSRLVHVGVGLRAHRGDAHPPCHARQRTLRALRGRPVPRARLASDPLRDATTAARQRQAARGGDAPLMRGFTRARAERALRLGGRRRGASGRRQGSAGARHGSRARHTRPPRASRLLLPTAAGRRDHGRS
jgi:hypothetical protein